MEIGTSDINSTAVIEDALMGIIMQRNNLVVNTSCNIDCVFCSRKFNPYQTKLFQKDFNLIRAEIGLFTPNKLIHINSAISTLTDGEPFIHPRIWDILALIRSKFPYRGLRNLNDKIKITTNGTLMTGNNLKKLEDLKGIILVHSVNSTDVDDFMKLTGVGRQAAEVAVSLPKRVTNFGITYSPSIVAMPEVVGYEGVERTLRDLVKEKSVKHLRVIMPTYTRFAAEAHQKMLHCDREKLENIIEGIRKSTDKMVVLYPIMPEDVNPKLEGLEHVGITKNDEILEIDGQRIFSRSEAMKYLHYPKKTLRIKFANEYGIRHAEIDPQQLRYESLVERDMNYDIGFDPINVSRIIDGHKKILIVTTDLAFKVVKAAFEKLQDWFPETRDHEYSYQIAKNDFYGGNVVSGGLLTVSDMRKAIKEFIDENGSPDLILTTRQPFDVLGRDIKRESIYSLLDEFKVKMIFL